MTTTRSAAAGTSAGWTTIESSWAVPVTIRLVSSPKAPAESVTRSFTMLSPATGAKVNVGPVAPGTAAPLRLHWYADDAASNGPGSVTRAPRVTLAGPADPEFVIATAGATFVAATVRVTVVAAPSLSVAVRAIVYVPSLSSRNARVWSVPVTGFIRYGPVTDQANRGVSFAPGSFARAVSVTTAPSVRVSAGPENASGLALIVGAGATFAAVIVAAPAPDVWSDPTATTRTSYGRCRPG
jgi:hypothetical protein